MSALVSTMNRKRNQKVRGRKTLRQKTSNGNSIPMIEGNFRQIHRYRFKATAAYSGSISSVELLGVPGMIAASATDLYPFTKSARIVRVEVWSPTATSSTPVDLVLTWAASDRTPNARVMDTSINVSQPAHISAKPPKDSLASFWFQDTDVELFTLICPAGSIVDLTMESILRNATSAAAVVTVTGATAGLTYYGYLDGDSTHLLEPVGRSTIF